MRKPTRKKQPLRDMPIWHKLLAVNLGIALLISAVSLIGFQFVARQSNRIIYTQTASAMSTISDKIASRMKTLLDASLNLAVNKEFQAHLHTLNSKPLTADQALARTAITSLMYRSFNTDIITLSIIPLNTSPLILGFSSVEASDEVLKRARTMAAEARGAPVCLPAQHGDGSILIAREVLKLDTPFLDRMGLLLIRVNLDKIVQTSSRDLLSGAYDITIGQNGEQLFPSAERDEPSIETVFNKDAPYAIRRLDGKMQFVTHAGIRTHPLSWDFMLKIPYNDVFFSMVFANTIFAISLALTVLLAILLSRRVLGGINWNIKLLTDKMDRVRKGDLAPYPNPPNLGQDELGTLNRHFDKMTGDFKQVIEDNYVKQLLLSQTQLKALEQQINPHFLYNSLETINWFARSGETRQVTAVAQSLGRLLRSTLSEDGDCITLRQELAILENYLSIQCIRFPDTLRVNRKVDSAAMDILIPKMSIQPLVENAIVHALEENIGECHVDVRVSLLENRLLVEVENDGSEIDEEILSKLRDKQVQPKGNGIGLMNIDARIKLLYGQEYGISLKNREERVLVSFCIPASTRDAGDGGTGNDGNTGKDGSTGNDGNTGEDGSIYNDGNEPGESGRPLAGEEERNRC